MKPRVGDSPGVRFLLLYARLNEAIAAYPDLRLIAYEQPVSHHNGPNAVLLGLAAHVQSWVTQHNKAHPESPIEHMSVNITELKRHATGRGNAKKEHMMAAARKRGWVFESDDEADAQWVRDYVETKLGGPS